MKRLYEVSLACIVVSIITGCSDKPPNEPDELLVKRLDPFHQTDIVFEKSIENTKEVNKLYIELINLPAIPKGTIHCPLNNGLQYELTFTLDDRSFAKGQ